MKIRHATKFDIPEIFEMLRHYRDAGTIAEVADIESDKAPLAIMTYILAGGGLAIVSEVEGKLTGMLLAIKTPNLWDGSKLVMNEIVYWVEPAMRGSTAGYRLIDKYVRECDDLKDTKNITNYTISQMAGSSLKYDRFGFKLTETTWSA